MVIDQVDVIHDPRTEIYKFPNKKVYLTCNVTGKMSAFHSLGASITHDDVRLQAEIRD